MSEASLGTQFLRRSLATLSKLFQTQLFGRIDPSVMAVNALGLNEQHQGIINSYMKFAQHQRQQNLKFIDISFQDVVNSRLNEPTYTKDEVEEILEQLKELVSGEVAAELIDTSHMNVLLMTQMLAQAEKWHLRMGVDFSEIQNNYGVFRSVEDDISILKKNPLAQTYELDEKELLEKVKIMEESESKTRTPHRLQPLSEGSGGSIELLRIEIDRLHENNIRLESDLTAVESKLKDLQLENDQFRSELDTKTKELDTLKDEKAKVGEPDENTPPKSDSEQLLGEYEKILSEQLSLELESMRQEYLSVQSQLTIAEKELERKFNQTAAYSNMKTMIAKKNEQVRELRSQLMNLQKNETSEP